jgi:hypothetical protein
MDFRIYHKDGTIIGLVHLERELHLKLMKKAEELNLKSILQFKEYWGIPRKQLASADLGQLNQEMVTTTQALYTEAPEVGAFRMELEALTNLANKESLPIIVVTE